MSGGATAVHFECGNPIFRVEDMTRSVRFYVDVLGFTSAGWGTDEFNCVVRDSAGIYLCLRGQGRGEAWAWVGVDDARRLHAECVARGAKIRMEPTNFPWALEFQVEDPDGNVLRFGSEPDPRSV